MVLRNAALSVIAALAAVNVAHAAAIGAGHEPHPSDGAHAGEHSQVSVGGVHGNASTEGPEKIGPRQNPASAGHRLLSTNALSEMMVVNNTIYLQMTDHGLKKIGAQQHHQSSDEGILGAMVRTVALSAVKGILNHSISLPLQETKSVAVRDGEVLVTTCDGKEIFNQVKINGSVQKYPQVQAEAFVRNLLKIRSSLPPCAVQ